jgi:hypothetical protein
MAMLSGIIERAGQVVLASKPWRFIKSARIKDRDYDCF